ncbi:hypothetical protein DM01DRAFT_1300819 [Hesseltinella vesiculosa]|uniref:Arrestin C-terminal-like domain-containing protein n=1 Tax=Hesseltinella vesiculosa TaxID=101127 RepID=A0A1X2GQZ7_9FUNG|nr:hypothetical protein DM01DRAFT_1300819 [Hesseltinella vesiculosa]
MHMRSRSRNKTNKAIDIRLNEEKFYFPGETIKGSVLVHPKNPTKTNHIIVRFIGQVHVSIKDKETIQLFYNSRQIPVSADEGKSTVLDAKLHSFPFEFKVPEDLPSTMEFDKRKTKIKYTLTAIHNRPMVPESLCAKVTYTVPILELIDVTSAQFTKSQDKSMDVLLPGIKYNQKCQLSMSIPRYGYTRGETVPLKIVINHFEPYSQPGALDVEMVRTVEIRTQKITSSTEDILKTMSHDVNIIGPYNFSQSMTVQWMIPTSTPPTIRYKDKTLHIHYKIRIRVQLATAKSKVPQTSTMEMPFVVGTWPRADVPIDDDDDGLVEMFGETMLSDDDDDEVNDLLDDKRYSIVSSTSLTKSSKPSDVVRSNSTMSHQSYGSISSRQSTHSLENLSRLSAGAGAGVATNIAPPSLAPIYQNHHLNRSSSTPDLLNNTTTHNQQHYYSQHGSMSQLHHPPAQPHSSQQPTYPYYDEYYGNQSTGYYGYYQPQQPQMQGTPSSNHQPPPLPAPVMDDVPTKVLEPITPSQPSRPSPPPPAPPPSTSISTNLAMNLYLSDDDDDDSDDDGDLLALIEKKKKQALREMRQRQQAMSPVHE